MQPMPCQPMTRQATMEAVAPAIMPQPPVPPEPATAAALWPTFMRRTLSDASLEACTQDLARAG